MIFYIYIYIVREGEREFARECVCVCVCVRVCVCAHDGAWSSAKAAPLHSPRSLAVAVAVSKSHEPLLSTPRYRIWQEHPFDPLHRAIQNLRRELHRKTPAVNKTPFLRRAANKATWYHTLSLASFWQFKGKERNPKHWSSGSIWCCIFEFLTCAGVSTGVRAVVKSYH